MIFSKIKELAALNKIELINAKSELITDGSGDGNDVFQKQIYAKTYGIYFLVEFEVCMSDSIIKSLKIMINEAIRREIGGFFESVEKNRNIHVLFKGIVNYARINQQRTQLFKYLKQKYSKLITDSMILSPPLQKFNKQEEINVEINNFLKFSDKSKNYPELLFVWNLSLTSLGRVIITDLKLIPLTPIMSHQWKTLDVFNIIDQIPSHFQQLVEVKGVQFAVEIIVKILFGLNKKT
ncbi:10394_t:CDS:2 [Entrophospora sp. SA101]|nr:15813_t:CDS:2 [Entrophospora sp. SA101]CAJ0636283.1 10394_t:CDS:2 [Entrophospora sp. SA101]CAJ0845995.1 10159_t:CDS:2 [Entrophospora sp. SA101]CAJ0872751.1 8727_t:CDS:2 [Entrophospora sp. SA101]